VQTAYNKLERTQQMLSVSQELLATRAESSRVLQQELAHGAALSSRAHMALAQEFDAKRCCFSRSSSTHKRTTS